MITLASCGNMTQAAKRLGITQPALSSYLSGVESSLGYPLFERTSRCLIPTYLGELYLEKAAKILALGDEFSQQLALLEGGYRGRLRIGVPSRRSPQLIPAVMKVFMSDYPRVELLFQEGNQHTLLKLLEEDQLDLLLCNLVEPRKNLAYRLIYKDPMFLLVTRSHPSAKYSEYLAGCAHPWIDLKLFRDEVFILQHEGQSLRHYSNRLLSAQNIHPNRIMLIRNIETAAQMTSLGLGVSFCLGSYLRQMHFTNPPLVFATGDQTVYAEFSVAYHKEKPLSECARNFIHILKSLINDV